MPRSRYFSLGRDNRTFDSKDFGKRVKKDAEASFNALIDEEINFVVNELRDLLRKIGEFSPKRGRGIHAERYNRPIGLRNSPIQVRKRINKETGQYTATIRVLNNKFNILDQGAPIRIASNPSKPIRFPRYIKARTEANSLDISRTKILDKQKVRTIVDGKKLVIGGWVTTQIVDEIKPRNFMLTISKKLRQRKSPFVRVNIRKS